MMIKTENVRAYFVSKLLDVRWSGNQGTARCPFHGDRRASLSVNAEEGLFFCHGCKASGNLHDFERRISKCGPRTAKARIAKLTHRGGGSKLRRRIVIAYSYRDQDKKLRFQQVRLEPKDFRFRRPDGDGGWIWNLDGVSKIIYRLPEVIQANKVFIVEGEKDVEKLREWGFTATCNPGGAGKWIEDYSRVFEGKFVVILQDNDEPGRKHALAVAQAVVPFATEVRLVQPFDNAKDVSEWGEKGGTRKRLLHLVKDTPPLENDQPSSLVAPDNANVVPDDWRAQPLRGVWAVALPETFFLDHLILPNGIPLVASLWTIGTHMFEHFDFYPYLTITSPTKRCGKTRFGETLELLCARPMLSVNVSEAALFRSIAKEKPTVIIDEAEALRNRESDRAQYILSILQSGFHQGAVVHRCVGRGFEVEKFPVYCPKAILAIGNLPDTLMDRSIVISMRRHLPSEMVARFRRRSASLHASGIVSAVTNWLEKHRGAIARAYLNQELDFLKDRDADIWEPLFAIASVAVPERLEELRQIATRLSGEKSGLDVDDTEGLRLLADIRTIFRSQKQTKLATAQLISKLKNNVDGHWGDDLTPVKLARILKPFGISSRQLWLGETNVHGYDCDDFKPAFQRYLSPEKH